ncbi:hypothetical protein F1C58_16170 (plasmid) [Glaciihabitans sp. INWT7]|uniref:hypothetical protein n=1 Tax=Glaciihabitans sp. INWT7 TaxID=2596912 RepID=UPI001629EC68|nr:hypothetical protein [Glaciihabitans sp. INWT7]QNE48595.1 hypothetical protein F1C58_16170 [Glaciihabitans sp. INWT7]
MGHNTETSFVAIAQAATPGLAIREAVNHWNDTERNRYEDAREGHSDTHPLMTPAAAERSMNEEPFRVYDGKSVAIPTCADADAVEKTTKHKLTVSAEDLVQFRRGNTWALTERLRKDLGHTVISFGIVSLPKARKAVATATEGKATTKYIVSFPGGKTIGTYHDSQSEARAAALATVNADPTISALEVTALIVRDSGSRALVSITRPEAETNEITVNVTTSEPKIGAKQAGWLVGFDYHS